MLLLSFEPTSALDVSVQAQILNLLRQLQRELRVSYHFITHKIGVVEYVADRIVVMNRGRVEEGGSVAEVLARPISPKGKRCLGRGRIRVAAVPGP